MPESACHIVTGGAGFVGSNLCAELVKRDLGARLIVIDDCRTGSFTNLIESFERRGIGPFTGTFIPADVAELDFFSLIETHRPATVFHEAAITDTTVADERAMLSVNTESFVPILRACLESGIPLVYASSAATYGSPACATDRRPFPLDSAGKPNNVYGFSKWLMECEHRRSAALHERKGGKPARVVGLRYFNVFGPGESRKGKMASMPFQLTRQMLEGKRPRLFRDGSQARDQIHVDDVVSCNIAAAEALRGTTPTSGVYNLGQGVATSFIEIVDAIRHGLGVSSTEMPVEYFDMPTDVRRFYQDFTCADISMTKSRFGWSPRVTAREGIASYATYLKERTSSVDGGGR